MGSDKDFTEEEYDRISEQLQKSLGPEWLTQRPGPSGRLTYIEGKTAINLANDIFGFNGWSSDIKDTTIDFVDILDDGRVNLGVSVTVRITLKDSTYHEDIGYGSAENCRSKAMAFEKARKQAVTDAIKRTLRNFGNALGNCIYDKAYLKGVATMASPQIKFVPSNLYRHNQFETSKKSSPTLPVQEDNGYSIPAIKPKTEKILPSSLTRQDGISMRPSTSTPVREIQHLIPEDGFSYEGDDIFDNDFDEADLKVLEGDISSNEQW
ncbi:hypothetical protein BY458DRAFT_488266 [Sporodiniella umbellata]|nr:hypothetical protein BY458DRAFT_488266 [Sporodiniella umbellata]